MSVVMSDADIEQNISLVASNLAVEAMLMLVLQLCCNYNSFILHNFLEYSPHYTSYFT